MSYATQHTVVLDTRVKRHREVPASTSAVSSANLTLTYPDAQSQYTTRCMLRSSPTKHCDGLPSISLQVRVMMMRTRQSHVHGLQLACDLRVEAILNHRDAVESQIADRMRQYKASSQTNMICSDSGISASDSLGRYVMLLSRRYLHSLSKSVCKHRWHTAA